MNQIVRIPSKLYFELYSKGSDSLLSVYCTLKSFKKDIKYFSYKSKNGRLVSGYNLLRNQTPLSLHTLKKYIPILMELGLCRFDSNGDFVLLGNNKLKNTYGKKLVPIKIGEKFTDTKYNCMLVRLHSCQENQKKEILIKQNRREILKQGLHNPKNHAEHKRALKVQSKYGDEIEVTDNCVLSNAGYGRIIKEDENISKGSHYKRRLKDKGLISSCIRLKAIKKVSYSSYIQYKRVLENGSRLTYKNGYMCEQLVSTLSVTDVVSGEIPKNRFIPIDKSSMCDVYKDYNSPKHLSFDFIGWSIGRGE